MRLNVIWDIDGTLSDASPFEYLIKTAPKNWDSWNDQLINHEPFHDLITLYHMYHNNGHNNYVVTARRENCRLQTEEWFKKHNLHMSHKGIYMRGMNDFRPDFEVKQDILFNFRNNGILIHKAYEDRGSVVEMYRSNGVRCLHVCDGIY